MGARAAKSVPPPAPGEPRPDSPPEGLGGPVCGEGRGVALAKASGGSGDRFKGSPFSAGEAGTAGVEVTPGGCVFSGACGLVTGGRDSAGVGASAGTFKPFVGAAGLEGNGEGSFAANSGGCERNSRSGVFGDILGWEGTPVPREGADLGREVSGIPEGTAGSSTIRIRPGIFAG